MDVNKFTRSATFEADTYNEQENTIEISFSSEFPVLRGSLGWEILSHSEGDADFSFIDSGNAPFLLDHRTDDYEYHVGVVKRAWIENKRGKALIKFSSDEEKQGVINDIKNGIRTSISFGYERSETGTLVGTIEGISAFKYKFRPYELSSVSVPADETVGVNRSIEPIIEKEEIKMDTQEIKTQEVKVNADEIRSIAVKEATQRALEITALCDKFSMSARSAEFIKSEKSLLDIKADILNEVEQRSANIEIEKKPVDVVRTGAPAVHTSEKPKFDIRKALLAAADGDWSQAGFEREMSQEHSNTLGRGWTPHSLAFSQSQVRADAISNVATASNVGNLVNTQYRPDMLINPLWASTILDQLPVQKMTGLKDNVKFPIVTSKASAWMIDEQGPIGDSEKITTTTKSLTPKQLVTKSAFTRQSLIQTNPNVQNLVYEQLYKAIAEKLDKMVFAKTATAGDLDSLFVAIATASQVTAGATNGAAPSRTKLLTVLNELGKRNITGTIDWASNGSVANTLANTLNDSANTASNYIIPAVGNGDMLLGKTLYQSNNIPSDFTKGTGTGLSGIIAGDFSECVVGQWDTIQVEIDRISGADNSLIYVRSYSFWDFVIKRIEAFQAMNDIITL